VTALPIRLARDPRVWFAPLVRHVARAVLLTAALGGVVLFRWVAAGRAPGEGLLVGLGFGTLLLVVALGAGWRPTAGIRTGVVTAIGAGLAVGLVLVTLALLIGRDQLPALRPAVPFLPWLAVTGLVATAEEVALRGALFDAIERIGGPVAAILVTSLAFSLLHVPFYGPHVLLLDIGVGLALGGLRLMTGGVRAPAVAHVVADAATWWM
jgi:membrane protease YdiL (CAAX protease family)